MVKGRVLHPPTQASQAALVVKNPPANAGRRRRCGFDPWNQEDPFEESMATHSSILAWRIPWTRSLAAAAHKITG